MRHRDRDELLTISREGIAFLLTYCRGAWLEVAAITIGAVMLLAGCQHGCSVLQNRYHLHAKFSLVGTLENIAISNVSPEKHELLSRINVAQNFLRKWEGWTSNKVVWIDYFRSHVFLLGRREHRNFETGIWKAKLGRQTSESKIRVVGETYPNIKRWCVAAILHGHVVQNADSAIRCFSRLRHGLINWVTDISSLRNYGSASINVVGLQEGTGLLFDLRKSIIHCCPLPLREIHSASEQQECEGGDSQYQAVSSNAYLNGRSLIGYFAMCSAFCLAYIGFMLIDANGMIKCETVSDRLKIASGFLFIGLALVTIHVALDIWISTR